MDVTLHSPPTSPFLLLLILLLLLLLLVFWILDLSDVPCVWIPHLTVQGQLAALGGGEEEQEQKEVEQ